MKRLLVTGLLGLAGMVAGCGGDDTTPCADGGTGTVTCGAGTTNVNNVCVANIGDGGTNTCGTNQEFNSTTGKCDLTAAACTQGLVLAADKQSCVKAAQGDLVAGPLTLNRQWNFYKYNNGVTLVVLGDGNKVTANVPDSTEMYLSGVGTAAPGGGGSDPANHAKFGLHGGGVLPVYWDANRANPSDTPLAIDHVITVGEWKKCTYTFSVYKNPPRADMKKYYRVVVDVAGCPPDLLFENWFQYFNGKFSNTRILGTPAGGIPNVFTTQQDGTGHWERDIDPAVWTKSGAMLNGNTHGAPGKGVVPDITANPDASFTMAVFVHNDGQSNGNAGWGAEADTPVAGVCGIPLVCGGTVQATPTSTKAYVYLPGLVGFDSTPSFIGGTDMTMVTPNTIPLSMLQPY